MSMDQTQLNLQRVNEQLDALVDISGNQRVIARSIGSELQSQQQMMSDVDGHMDRTQNEVQRATWQLGKVRAEGGTCAAWILMVILLAAIVVVWVVPF